MNEFEPTVIDNLNDHNIAEIELSFLLRQCLGRRAPSRLAIHN
jgi:hypothetical protein